MFLKITQDAINSNACLHLEYPVIHFSNCGTQLLMLLCRSCLHNSSMHAFQPGNYPSSALLCNILT